MKSKKIGNGLAVFSIILAVITLALLWFVFQKSITDAMLEKSVGLLYFWDALSFLALFSAVLAFFKLKKNKHSLVLAIVGMILSVIAIGFCVAATMGIKAIQTGVGEAMAG